jgi:hypothetical protein
MAGEKKSYNEERSKNSGHFTIDFGTIAAVNGTEQPVNPKFKTAACQSLSTTLKSAEDRHLRMACHLRRISIGNEGETLQILGSLAFSSSRIAWRIGDYAQMRNSSAVPKRRTGSAGRVSDDEVPTQLYA